MYQLHKGLKFQTISVDELLKILPAYKYKLFQVHHTWRPNHSQWKTKPDGTYWASAIDSYHRNTNKWSAIGEHANINPDGSVTLGRSFSRDPAGIKNYNSGAFMIEMIGDFDEGKDQFTGKQKETVLKIARYFDSRGIKIMFHREGDPSKTCPGSGIDKDQFMKEVRGDMTLRKGDKNSKVKKLQEDLIKLGYSLAPYGADGSYGAVTEQAVRKFQADNKLSVDGIAGPATQNKIAELLSKKNNATQPKANTALEARVLALEKEVGTIKDKFAKIKGIL